MLTLSCAAEGLERAGSLWNSSPADWFADFNSGIQDNGLQKTWEDAAAAMGPLPESLGKVDPFIEMWASARAYSQILPNWFAHRQGDCLLGVFIHRSLKQLGKALCHFKSSLAKTCSLSAHKAPILLEKSRGASLLWSCKAALIAANSSSSDEHGFRVMSRSLRQTWGHSGNPIPRAKVNCSCNAGHRQWNEGEDEIGRGKDCRADPRNRALSHPWPLAAFRQCCQPVVHALPKRWACLSFGHIAHTRLTHH